MVYKICFITALFNNKVLIDKPGKFKRHAAHNYYLFTNFDNNVFNTSWTVITVPDFYENNIRTSRYYKFKAWEYFEKTLSHYDVIFYCDAYLSPKYNVEWCNIATTIVAAPFGVMQAEHPQKKGGVVAELHRITRLKKDTTINVNNTIKYLDSFKVDLSSDVLYANTVFGYSNTAPVRKFMTQFVDLYMTKYPSIRDQPLWNTLLIKNNYTPIIYPRMKEQLFQKTGTHSIHNINTYKM